MATDGLKWVSGHYGGVTLFVGDGLIKVYCDWAMVAKGEEGYYYTTINQLRLKKHFKSMDEAQAAGVRVAFKMASVAAEQLKNFLEE